MKNRSIIILLSAVLVGCFMAACNERNQTPVSQTPATPLATPAPTQSLSYTPEMSVMEVDVEECAQNLGKNTGKEYKAKGLVLQLTKDQYVEFVRKDMYAYRSGGYPSATDPRTLKCSIRVLDYINLMSPDRRQFIADLYMTAFKIGYEGK
jgi:hypothetical protein